MRTFCIEKVCLSKKPLTRCWGLEISQRDTGKRKMMKELLPHKIQESTHIFYNCEYCLQKINKCALSSDTRALENPSFEKWFKREGKHK